MSDTRIIPDCDADLRSVVGRLVTRTLGAASRGSSIKRCVVCNEEYLNRSIARITCSSRCRRANNFRQVRPLCPCGQPAVAGHGGKCAACWTDEAIG